MPSQLALELVADFLVASPLPSIPVDSKRYGKMLVSLALSKKTAKTAVLLGRAAVFYSTFAEAALRTWRERARMLDDDRAGITALRWRLWCEQAQAERNAMREAMSLPQLEMLYARRELAQVPELTPLQPGVQVLDQLRECVDLCVLRGRTLERYAARHPEAAAELRELEFDEEDEETEAEEVVDSDEGL